MNKNLEIYSKIIITGGAGFIGTNLIIKLLKETSLVIYNIDKLGYASDHFAIDYFLKNSEIDFKQRYKLIKCNLSDKDEIFKIVQNIKPDLVMHLAAESHVDKSIDFPQEFLDSNIYGTFNLLNACLNLYSNFDEIRKKRFRFLHISTDEVFGTLSNKGSFTEESRYDPRSPYSATKAASDHLVKTWFHTYGLPILISNCGNNYGPWQFPEKLIPTIIYSAFFKRKIPIYGNGLNIRDWIYVEDHINALLEILLKGKIGESYCVGSSQEFTNIEIANFICDYLDKIKPIDFSYSELITFVEDRPGHDKRYSINPQKISKDLGWRPIYSFNHALESTVDWYLSNIYWCENLLKKHK
tara:strand:- start:16 stop:1080 length:1065 start_codon:yes stop_codon:yes gene_type:complete